MTCGDWGKKDNITFLLRKQFLITQTTIGVYGAARVGRGTALQTGRLRVRFPMESRRWG
jgi:hypothetical protein